MFRYTFEDICYVFGSWWIQSCWALSVRVKDLDLESKPAQVFVRGEYTKTKADRVARMEDIKKRQEI